MSRPVRAAGAVLGALLTCGTIVDAADLDRAAGLLLFTEQKLMAMLAVALVLAYLVFPARRGAARASVPWYDWIAIAAAAATCAYIAYDYERIFEELHERPLDATVGAVVIVVLVAEGLRRAAGWVLFGFMAFFVAFGLLGHYVPGQFQGRAVDVDRMFIYIALDTNGLVGIPDGGVDHHRRCVHSVRQPAGDLGRLALLHRNLDRADGALPGRIVQDRGDGVEPVRFDLGLGGRQRRLDRRDYDPLDAKGRLSGLCRRRDRGGRLDRRPAHAVR